MNIIDTFEIPVDIADRLSDLMTVQSIREKLLISLIDQPDKYNKMEAMLASTVSEIDQIKAVITNQYVPEEYRSEKYNWNYNGNKISGNIVDILLA